MAIRAPASSRPNPCRVVVHPGAEAESAVNTEIKAATKAKTGPFSLVPKEKEAAEPELENAALAWATQQFRYSREKEGAGAIWEGCPRIWFSSALMIAMVIKEVELWDRDNNKVPITQCCDAIDRRPLSGMNELLSASEHTSWE